MYYKRIHQIEQRLQQALILMETSLVNINTLAKNLGVSKPTATRTIGELRRRGYLIRSVHDGIGWRYEIVGKKLAPQKYEITGVQNLVPILNMDGVCLQSTQIRIAETRS